MALPLEKTHSKVPQKSLKRTQAAESPGAPVSRNDPLIKALIAASADAAPFDKAEKAYPREAEALVAHLVAHPLAAQAYLQSLGFSDEQDKLPPEYDQE